MGYQLGDTVAAFTLPRAGGGDLTVDPRAAAATVVVFTANHCPYALAWHERIQQVARDHAADAVQFVQINANDEVTHPGDSTQASAKRVEAGEFASPYLRDTTQDLTRAWGAERTPDVFVVDAAGTLVYRGAPDGSYDDEAQGAVYLREAISAVLTGTTVVRPQTASVGCTIKRRQ